MGWQRQILRVNLSEGRAEAEPLNMEWAHDFLGERGLATKYLMENMAPQADALRPDIVLIFATGPLSGTMASTSGRYAGLMNSASPRFDRWSQTRFALSENASA